MFGLFDRNRTGRRPSPGRQGDGRDRDRYINSSFQTCTRVPRQGYIPGRYRLRQRPGILPLFPGAKAVEHESFLDPTAVVGSEETKLTAFCSVRDAILKWIEKLN